MAVGVEKMVMNEYFLVFDVESIGLHGYGFAVAWVVVDKEGKLYSEGLFSIPRENIVGMSSEYKWAEINIPPLPITHKSFNELTLAFWEKLEELRFEFPDLTVWADCCWPVETNFLSECTTRHSKNDCWDAPYPLFDIATVLQMKGKDPTAHYPRQPDELPAHNPLNDARQSARLLLENL